MRVPSRMRGCVKPAPGVERSIEFHLRVGQDPSQSPGPDPCDALEWIGLIRELVNRIGLVHEVHGRLDLFKRHPSYCESDLILNVAYNILCGGGRR